MNNKPGQKPDKNYTPSSETLCISPGVITPETVCVPSSAVVSREIEHDLIIIPLTSGIGDRDDEFYTLNRTARAIWNSFDGKRTIRDIAGDLSEEYHTSLDVVTQDLLGLANELVKRKILICYE